jgi:leucyl aminopeptidase
MKLEAKKVNLNSIKKDDLFIILSEEQIKTLRKSPKTTQEKEISKNISKEEFSGKRDQFTTLHSENLKLRLLGAGKEKELNKESARWAAGTIANIALGIKLKEFSINSKVPKLSEEDSLQALTEGLILGQYRFDKYKTEDNESIKIKSVTFITSLNKAQKIIKKSEIICNASNYVRDLQMENADVATPLYLEKQARQIAKKNKLKIKVLDEKILKKLGAGLILAVGKGSKYPPRIVILEYKGNPKSKETTAILGKGITFDSGGLNLKPTNYIETMREDMSGAAAVLGTIKAAAELKLKKNLIGVVSTAENAIGSAAYKPGDVVKSLSGKTVEIGNTDAEGRLVLADALTYTEKNYKLTNMIDLATLTGAVLVALGDYVAGMSGTDKKMISKLKKSGENTHERVWELPLLKDYIGEVKSETADLNNINYGRNAGAIMGAAFLSKFIEKTPWTHIDIAGTSWLESKRGYYQKGATGFGVRLLIDYLENN